MKKAIVLLLLGFAPLLRAQSTQYFKDSDMKGFPQQLRQLIDYKNISKSFDYFKMDEPAFNAVFYRSYVSEGSESAKFKRLDITMSKKFEIEPALFPNYKLVLNPKLEPEYVSKQPLLVSIRETSISAVLTTASIGWVFPANILQTKDKQPAQAIINTTAVEYHNDGSLNKYHGLLIKEAKGFSLAPSLIPDSGIELTDCSKAEAKFLDTEAFEFPNLVFENNQLSNFISNYKKANKSANILSPGEYKASLLLKNITGTMTFAKPLDCNIAELYFFANAVAGVIDFPLTGKKAIITELNSINKVSNRGNYKLKVDGQFPTIIDTFNQTYFKIEQDSKSVRMYFIIVK
jgi:hypothetical protein